MVKDILRHAHQRPISTWHPWQEPLTQLLRRREGQPHCVLYLYVVTMAVIAVVTLLFLFASIPPGIAEELSSSKPTPEQFRQIQALFIMTIGMMLCCGALGGCLFDLRGLIQHSAHSDFDRQYYGSYLLRPFAGAMSGFIVFLILVGGLFALDVQPPKSTSGEFDWIILRRQLPFMAFATLAGYSSHVFTGKLKAISEVIFSRLGGLLPTKARQRKREKNGLVCPE